jgi:hypothetical protein
MGDFVRWKAGHGAETIESAVTCLSGHVHDFVVNDSRQIASGIPYKGALFVRSIPYIQRYTGVE